MSSPSEIAAAAVSDDLVSSSEDAPKACTKQRILDVAERLFSLEGFDTVSLRRITDEAGVNLAAVNYHYGSKDELILAVLKNRILPLNIERVKLLREAVAAAGKEPLTVREISKAYVGPVLRAVDESFRTNVNLALLISRFVGDQSDHMQKMLFEQFPELAQCFVHELCRAVPGIPPSDALLRILFAEGALFHSLVYHQRLHVLVEGEFETPTITQLEAKLLPFIIEGFTAPLPELNE